MSFNIKILKFFEVRYLNFENKKRVSDKGDPTKLSNYLGFFLN